MNALTQKSLTAAIAPLGLVGETPLISCDLADVHTDSQLYLKLEDRGLTGRVEDRLAAAVVATARHQHGLTAGKGTLIISDIGTQSLALTAAGTAAGYNCVVVATPDFLASHGQHISDLEADIVQVPGTVTANNGDSFAKTLAETFPNSWVANRSECRRLAELSAQQLLDEITNKGADHVDLLIVERSHCHIIDGLQKILHTGHSTELLVVGNDNEPCFECNSTDFSADFVKTHRADDAHAMTHRVLATTGLQIPHRTGALICAAREATHQELIRPTNVVVIVSN